MHIKRFTSFASDYRVQIIGVVVGSIILLGLLWIKLGSLTHGNAADIEVMTQAAATSWTEILHNPLNLPYNVIIRLLAYTGHDGITSLRLISTMFAILAAVLFYMVALQWHNARTAILAAVLFITSAWFLHVGRLGTPEILWLVSTLGIVVLLTPNRNGRQTRLALPTTLVALALILYVPGMVWLVLAGIIVRRKNIAEAWAATKAGWMRALSILLATLTLVPLVFGLATNPDAIKEWLGFGTSLPDPANIGRNFLSVPLSLGLFSSFDPVHWLGRLPILSVFELVALVIGMYFYATHFRAARTRLIAVLALIGVALVGIMGVNAISLVLPVVYLLIASGIAYLLHLWLKVFPNNPIARTVGIVVITCAIVLTSVYQTRSYFIAWQHNPETTVVFRNKL